MKISLFLIGKEEVGQPKSVEHGGMDGDRVVVKKSAIIQTRIVPPHPQKNIDPIVHCCLLDGIDRVDKNVNRHVGRLLLVIRPNFVVIIFENAREQNSRVLGRGNVGLTRERSARLRITRVLPSEVAKVLLRQNPLIPTPQTLTKRVKSSLSLAQSAHRTRDRQSFPRNSVFHFPFSAEKFRNGILKA